MTRTTFALATAILLTLPCAASAQLYPPGPAPVVPAAPAARPTLRQIFHWLDTNHDGFLELGEFLAAPWVTNRAQATEFFSWMDTNKDGRVSLAEFLAAHRLYSGPSGYTYRVTYPWAWTYWRPWRYGWTWHPAGWRSGWAGGWWHSPRAGAGRVAVNRNRGGRAYRPAAHRGRVAHPHQGKHPKRHAKRASRTRARFIRPSIRPTGKGTGTRRGTARKATLIAAPRVVIVAKLT